MQQRRVGPSLDPQTLVRTRKERIETLPTATEPIREG